MNKIGDWHSNQQHFEQALDYFDRLHLLAKKIPSSQYIHRSYLSKAFVYRQSGDTKKALNYLLTAASNADSLQNVKLQLEAYFELGDFYRLQQNFDKSIEYLKKSLDYDPQKHPEINSCKRMFTLASLYKQRESIEEQKKGIDLYEQMLTNNCNGQLTKVQKSKLLNNLGSAYVAIDDFKMGGIRLTEALKLKRGMDDPVSLAYTLNEWATFHYRQDQFKEALKFAEEARENVTKDVFLLTDILENLYLAYASVGRYEKALSYSHELQHLKDSIFHEQKQTLLAEMATKYDLAKKEKDLATKDLKIIQQKNEFNQIAMIAVILILLIGLLYLWARQQWREEKAATQKLQELDQIKSTFFTNISHEFRTPLTLISSIFELKSRPGSKEQIQFNSKEVDIVQRNTQRLLELIDQLMDLAKLDAGKMKLQVSKGNIYQFIQQLLTSFESLAKQQHIRLQFISRNPDFTLWFDADKVEKILINLLSNAIKFTPKDGDIKVFLEKEEAYAQIIVQDNGLGIDQEHITHIFDRFHQADNSSTRAYEGTGIGLALVQQMVLAHRGHNKVESQKEKGTTFIIRLPIDETNYQTAEKVERTLQSKKRRFNTSLLSSMTNNKDQGEAATDSQAAIIQLIEDRKGRFFKSYFARFIHIELF